MNMANRNQEVKTSSKKAFPLWAKIVLIILLAGLVFWVVLAAMGIVTFKKLQIIRESVTTQIENVSDQDALALNEHMMDAQTAIKNYLSQANANIQQDLVVKSGDKITVDYIGRLNEKEVFDTSVESVAKAAALFNPQRNYSEGLSFTVGAGEMIPGFDEGVVDMKVGETKTITIPAEKAYGERNEELVFRVPLEEAGDTSGAEVGMKILL